MNDEKASLGVEDECVICSFKMEKNALPHPCSPCYFERNLNLDHVIFLEFHFPGCEKPPFRAPLVAFSVSYWKLPDERARRK